MSANIKTAIKTNKKRILIVDDLASDSRLVKLYLEQTNEYLVREENDPEAAVSAAEEFQPHLILLDIMMPVLDGGELAARFEANPKLKAVPIVFLTCVISREEVGLVKGRIGRYPVLSKPIVLTEVAACIKQHLGGGEAN